MTLIQRITEGFSRVSTLLKNKVNSDTTGIPGATNVNNIIIITSAGYDSITPDPNTYYIIKD